MQKRTESGHLAGTWTAVRFHAARMHWLLSPAAMAVAAFVIAFAAAMSHYAERGGIGLSWQSSYAPAVFLACTGTFGMPRPPQAAPLPDWDRALDDFLQQRSPEFDCSTIPEGLEVHWFASSGGHPSSLVSLQAGQVGHLFLTGMWWKLVGVSWWKVVYVGALYAGAAFAALALILCRFIWAPLALPAAFLPFLDFQTLHLIERLRDFGKVPAIYLAILLLLMATTAGTRRGVPLCLLALGPVLGIGVLLRSEMMIYALGVLMIAALVVIARRSEISLKASVLALVACAGTVLAVQMASRVAYPERPGYMSHALILGMQDQRLWETHIDVHGLSLMPIFSDQSVYRNAQLLHSADGTDTVSYQTDEYGGYTNIAFRRMAADAPYFALLRIAGAA